MKATRQTERNQGFSYRVGFLGCPSYPELEWNLENLKRLKSLGFNTIQLNIAWGCRPGDEPLNLEDLVELPKAVREDYPEVAPLLSDRSPQRLAERRKELRKRIILCRQLGLRTIFHFGAPYNAHSYFGDTVPNCVLDGRTTKRYQMLVKEFGKSFPEVDDILVYTYDQDAWQCSEFGHCPRCAGVPLDRRLPDFIHAVAHAWRKVNPQGRMWWEPWELSAGQVLQIVGLLDPEIMGICIHSNVAEVMIAYPVDRWAKNVCHLAQEKGLPTIIEHFLGAAHEEVEPFNHLVHPQVTFRSLQTIHQVPGVGGIKEYYGLLPHKEDPNLRITGIFFANPGIPEKEALRLLAEPYEKAASQIVQFWDFCSEAIELYPWDISWFSREVGRGTPIHNMSAAFLRGANAHTPSWESSRRSMYMKCDNSEPDPWLLEDVQIRCGLAAERMKAALDLGNQLITRIPNKLQKDFRACLKDLQEFHRLAVSYVCHIRESNLTLCMRTAVKESRTIPKAMVSELLSVLRKDQENQGQEQPIQAAIDLLEKNPYEFTKTYFQIEPEQFSKGLFTLTSR